VRQALVNQIAWLVFAVIILACLLFANALK
jgi:hypothetical protein